MCLQRSEDKEINGGSQYIDFYCSSVGVEDVVTQFSGLLGQPTGLGLPGQALPLKPMWSLEDVFIIVFTVVDDEYKRLFGGPAYFRTSPNDQPVFSDAEVITLALVAELAGYRSGHGWWRYVAKNYRYLFPRLCDRTRYGRRLKRLRGAMEQVRQHLLFLLNADLSQLRVVDSFPLAVCHLRRLPSSTHPFEYYASRGYCAAKKEYFYGLRVHLVTDTRGIVVGYVLTPAHVHDTQGVVFLLQDLSQLGPLLERMVTLLGDKGYVGQELARQLKAEFRVELLAMQREYDQTLGQSAYNETIGQARKIIETTISVLTGILNANWTYARSITGLVTNLVAKMTAFTLGNYLNRLMGEPVLQVASIVS